MAVLPDDLLELAQGMCEEAERLPDIPKRDAICRTAVNRAYYAVYHAALALGRRQGFGGSIPGYSSHEALGDGWLAERPGYEDLAADGDEIKSAQTPADYRI